MALRWSGRTPGVLELTGEVWPCFIRFCMTLRFNYFIAKEIIIDILENVGKQEEKKARKSHPFRENTTYVLLCALLCMCACGVDILMKTRCGCCCRKLCLRSLKAGKRF